jgi:hypothetical protein
MLQSRIDLIQLLDTQFIKPLLLSLFHIAEVLPLPNQTRLQFLREPIGKRFADLFGLHTLLGAGLVLFKVRVVGDIGLHDGGSHVLAVKTLVSLALF